MAEAADAHALVSAARDFLRIDDVGTAGMWPGAAALLARQGLEAAMARLWQVTAPGLERTSARCQLLCVAAMLNDRELGGKVSVTWNALSGACHHGAYELPPTTAELQGALETVWHLADAVEQLRDRVGPQQP
jgi:hypothetical protein